MPQLLALQIPTCDSNADVDATSDSPPSIPVLVASIVGALRVGSIWRPGGCCNTRRIHDHPRFTMEVNGNARLQKEANGIVGFWKRWWDVQTKQNLNPNDTNCWNPGCKDKIEMWICCLERSPATKSRYHLPQKKPQHKNCTHCKSTGSTAE